MPPLAEPEALGCWALELEALLLGEVALAPPEAEGDFAASLEPDPLTPAEELDEEPGADGLVVAPPLPPTEAEPEAEPDGPEGGVLLGEEAVLELEEPGAVARPAVSSRSQAARPKASAAAAAKMESFMCPPWLGYK